MSSRYTRADFLRRTAAGGTVLTLPGLLAACGGGSKSAATTAAGGGTQTMPKSMVFSNWPLYIDVNEKSKKHPSLDQFTKKTGVKVKYIEDINDNDSFFGKIEGPLSQGQGVGRDIIVLTDSSGLPARMIELGWLEKLDKSAIPNLKNLVPALQQHSPCELVGHSAPSMESTTKVESGLHEISVGFCTSAPGALFWT